MLSASLNKTFPSFLSFLPNRPRINSTFESGRVAKPLTCPYPLKVQARPPRGSKEGNVLFNDALNTFYLRLHGVRHMVKDHSDSEKGKTAAAT